MNLPSKGRILIVANDEGVRSRCRQVLEEEGHDVDAVEDGVVGLEKARGARFDRVLIQLDAPGTDGLDLIAQMRELDPGMAPIALVGPGNVALAVAAMRSGAVDCLAHPWAREEILQAVQRGLELHALRSESDAAATEYVATVAHELRAPLAAIEGWLDVILSGAAGEDEAQRRAWLVKIKNRAHSLMELVNDLLVIRGMNSGRATRTREPLSLATVITEAAELHRQAAERAQVALRLDLPENLPPVQADRREMERLFTNLLSNAIKYNVPGGSVTVAAAVAEGLLRVTVQDTGIGIRAEDLPHVFEEFFRAQDQGARDVSGTGLGLAISRKIVEAHRGRIEVDSRPGQGTTFTVFLPLADG